MCGIWSLIGEFSHLTYGQLFDAFMKIKNRGPDRSEFFMVNDVVPMLVGFHRLSIMDPTSRGDQPFVWETKDTTNYCICNGEIYNYQKLIKKYDLKPKSKSDCEVIPLLYDKIGIYKMLEEFNGEFSFLIIQLNHQNKQVIVHAATDPCSVRSMFYLEDKNSIAFCSEMIGLLHDKKPLFGQMKRFPSGHVMTIVFNEIGIVSKKIEKYFEFRPYNELIKKYNLNDYNSCVKAVHDVLTECIIDRLHADKPIGAFLSGGLDSGIVCSVSAKELKKTNHIMDTFCIGLDGGTDEIPAKETAEYIGTNHTIFKKTPEEFINYQREHVIKNNGSYDNTTTRASTGQDLCSYEIATNTQIKVVLSGDGSDELFGGYMENHNCPNEEEFRKNQIMRMRDIHYYDGLRVDRGVSENGLEARTPFLDQRIIKLALSIPVKFLLPQNGVEKKLLRDSFKGYLPYHILNRPKEAFSDGVSGLKKSWYEIVQEEAQKKYGDKWIELSKKYTINKPYSPETLYYREIFCEYYGEDESVAKTIPYYWVQSWSDSLEPSARTMDSYKSRNK